MKKEWIKPFEDFVGRKVNLPGNTSTSRDPCVALGFATDHEQPDHIPVLFVFLIKNYQSPRGILMTNEAYTAYPDEGEFLLMEGIDVHVLSIEHGYKLQSEFLQSTRFNGKTITIIHLFTY